MALGYSALDDLINTSEAERGQFMQKIPEPKAGPLLADPKLSRFFEGVDFFPVTSDNNTFGAFGGKFFFPEARPRICPRTAKPAIHTITRAVTARSPSAVEPTKQQEDASLQHWQLARYCPRYIIAEEVECTPYLFGATSGTQRGPELPGNCTFLR